jgi:hypothetical protein
MNYLGRDEEEWPISFGMVESAGKQFKARLAGPGMRWGRTGVEDLQQARCAILGGGFDDVWTKAQTSPPA